MKISREDGSLRLSSRTGDHYLHFYNQWPALLRPGGYHWVDFSFIALNVEWGAYKGRYVEVCSALLGIHLDYSYYRNALDKALLREGGT